MVRSIWRIISRYGIHCPVHLRKCADVCPASAREIVGYEYTIKELVKELMKDQMFYEQSGGGVTFSGGEVMSVDMDFVLAAAKELDRQGISLTIDTCGYAPYERFQKILLM